MTSIVQEPTLKDALTFLANRCDGAHAVDGAGFNKLDANFGKSLARQEGPLTQKQTDSALRMLRKYRKQLGNGGIDFEALKTRTEKAQRERLRTTRNYRGIVTLEGERFVLSFPYDPNLVEAVRSVPDRRWDSTRKVNTVPISRCLEVERFALDNGLQIDPEAGVAIDSHRAGAEAERERVEGLIAASKAEDADIKLPVQGLRPFQKAGAAYCLDRRRTFLADEMGLGKTVQALTTIEAANAYPVLVICPKSVVSSWRNEARMWVPHRTVQVIDTKTPIGKADITIIHYDAVKKRLEGLAGPILDTKIDVRGKERHTRGPSWVRSLVLDEIHWCKSRGAARTMAVQEIAASLADDDPIILGLSGTPLINRPSELITQLGILRRLNDIGGYRRFWWRFCGGEQGGAQNLNELNTLMRSHCMVRRLKADVLTELPPKTWATVETSLSNNPEYRRAEAKFLAWVREQDGPEAAMRAARAETITRMNALRKLAALGKLPAALQWCTDFLESDGKLVVFAYHKEAQDALLQGLARYNPRAIRSEMSVDAREKAVHDFQEDETVRVMVCSLMAGSEGITLTASSNAAFLELAWTPARMSQAVDRTHRIGQRDAVTGWQLIAPKTIDDDLSEILLEKQKISDEVLDGRAAAEVEASVANDVISRMMKR